MRMMFAWTRCLLVSGPQIQQASSAWAHRLVTCCFVDMFDRCGRWVCPAGNSSSLPDVGLDARCTAELPAQEHSSSSARYFALPLSSLSTLEVRFLCRSKAVVAQMMNDRFSVDVSSLFTDLVLCRTTSDGGTALLGPQEVAEILRDVEGDFCCGPAMHLDYRDIVWPVLKASFDAVHSLVPDLFPTQLIEQSTAPLSLLPNVPFGGSMVAYDFSYETDPSHCRVSYPNYNILSESHHEHFFSQRPYMRRQRMHYHYILRALVVPPHEVIHLYQGIARQRDSSASNASAEFGARFVESSLLHHVATEHLPLCRTPELSDASTMFANGVLEAALLSLVQQHVHAVQEAVPADMAEWIKERDSFGTYDPQYFGRPIHSGVFAFHDSTDKLVQQLRLVFDGRFNVDTFKQLPQWWSSVEEQKAAEKQRTGELMVPSRWLTECPPPVDEIIQYFDGAELHHDHP